MGARPDSDRPAFLDQLARHLAALAAPHPLRIGIDGVDGSGKTMLADELAPRVRGLERPVLRASIDPFHHPARHRHRAGRHSAEGDDRDSFDLETLRACLLDPLGPGGSRRIRTRCFDHQTDSPARAEWQSAPPAAVLLFDGVFLQRPELMGCFERVLFLDVPFDVMVERMAACSGVTATGPDDARYARYVGGQRIYLRECDPGARADLLVDHHDWRSPRLRRGGSSS